MLIINIFQIEKSKEKYEKWYDCLGETANHYLGDNLFIALL